MSTTVAADRDTSSMAPRIREKLKADSRAMTIQIARELAVPEVEVIRAMSPDQVTELEGSRWQELVRAFEGLGALHVVASNAATTLECIGEFGNFSTWHGYLNVQTKTIDMHIRQEAVVAAYAVIKPSHMDGTDTLSFQFFDHAGHAAFKVFLTFGGKNVPGEKRETFDRLRTQFKREVSP